MNSTSPGIIQIVISVSLLLHAIAHAIVVVAMTGQVAFGGVRKKIAAQAWLLKAHNERSSTMLLLVLWAISTLMFFGAAASSWGVIVSGKIWNTLAISGALVSTLSVVLTAGLWPGSQSRNRAYLNSTVAMVMNMAILTARIWFQWLPTHWVLS